MFRSEVELTDVLLEQVATRLSRDGASWVILTECEWDTRIPDIVLLRVNNHAMAARAAASFSRSLTRTEVSVLRVLRPDRATSLEVAHRHLGLTREHARKVLTRLASDGVVLRQKNGNYVRHADYRPLADRIVSIEVKRSAWRPALVQARAHQSAANAAYVAYDAAYRARFLAASDHFRACGIGVIEVPRDPEQRASIQIPARRSRRLQPIAAAFAMERMWAHLNGERTSTERPETRLPGGAARSVDRAPVLIPPESPRDRALRELVSVP